MKPNKIGKYQVERMIGEGSFGKVYLAKAEGGTCAIKSIPKRSRTLSEIRNLKSQTELLSKLKHENIIAMKEFFETQDQFAVVMEYAGDDLSRLLEKQKKLSEERVRFYGKQILSAMLYLHQNRVLHRDLKPQNILLQEDKIKLCDFGFAKKMSASTNFLRSIKGTPLYIAPEILQSKPYTHKVDVWSFGIILYELAYGKTPFYATTIPQLQPKILHQAVKYPKQMSSMLRELIDGMLQKSHQKRFDWPQVKNHPFFQVQCKPIPKPLLIFEEKLEKVEPVKQVKWIAEQQCAYLNKIELEIDQGKIKIVDVKFSQEYSLRVIQFLGEVCVDRSKIPRQILVITLQRLVKLVKSKQVPEGNSQEDIAKNPTLMTAIITLALDEQEDQIQAIELEIIGYLLQQNFDKIKIDTDHDDQITTLISRKLLSKDYTKTTNYCLKVLGILTSQALLTLNNSQDYFQRLSDEKLLSIVAELYSPAPEHCIVLEVLDKFIHPRLERNCQLTHKTKAIFQGFKEQVAPILLRKGLITQESPLKRNWRSLNQDLQIYCGVLYELLTISKQVRDEYLKRNYWKQLLTQPKAKIYFVAMTLAILKGSGVYDLSNQVIQNEIVVDNTGNKLINVFLLYFTPQHFNQQVSRTSNQSKKIEKLKITMSKVEEFLKNEQALKTKWCKQLLGYFSQEGRFFDDLLIQTLYNLAKDAKEQQIINYARSIAEQALLLPLSEESITTCFELIQKNPKPLGPNQNKKMDEYLAQQGKREGFDDYLSVNPSGCTRLISKLLKMESLRIQQQVVQQIFVQLCQKSNFLRFLFSEQLINQQLTLYVLIIINKIIGRIRSIDFLAHSGFQTIKKHLKTNQLDLRIELITFCSHLARMKAEYCRQLLDNGIVVICFKALQQQKELLIEKALHLIGNLSKHNNEAFQKFQDYQIVLKINRCVSLYHKNRRILKNTIYAIGNIAYYGEQFSFQTKQLVKYLLEGLTSEDSHLMLNTISTINNLLRHSSYHLQSLIECGIFPKLLEIYTTTSNPDQGTYITNCLRKASNFAQFFNTYPKDSLKKIIEANIRRGLLKEGDSNVRSLRAILNT